MIARGRAWVFAVAECVLRQLLAIAVFLAIRFDFRNISAKFHHVCFQFGSNFQSRAFTALALAPTTDVDIKIRASKEKHTSISNVQVSVFSFWGLHLVNSFSVMVSGILHRRRAPQAKEARNEQSFALSWEASDFFAAAMLGRTFGVGACCCCAGGGATIVPLRVAISLALQCLLWCSFLAADASLTLVCIPFVVFVFRGSYCMPVASSMALFFRFYLGDLFAVWPQRGTNVMYISTRCYNGCASKFSAYFRFYLGDLFVVWPQRGTNVMYISKRCCNGCGCKFSAVLPGLYIFTACAIALGRRRIALGGLGCLAASAVWQTWTCERRRRQGALQWNAKVCDFAW